MSIRHWARRVVVSTRYAESPLIPDTERLAATAMAAVTSFIQSSRANISPAFPSFLIPVCTGATSSHVYIFTCIPARKKRRISLSLSVFWFYSEMDSTGEKRGIKNGDLSQGWGVIGEMQMSSARKVCDAREWNCFYAMVKGKRRCSTALAE